MCRPPEVVGGRRNWLWGAVVAHRPWSGQGAAVGQRAGCGLVGAVVVSVGCLPATAVANRLTARPAEAACGFGVVRGHVLWLWVRQCALEVYPAVAALGIAICAE